MATVIHHSRVQWHLYKTPTRHLNQQHSQSQINQEVRHLCLHSKYSRTHQSYKRTHSRTCTYAEILLKYYCPPILQTRKPDNGATQLKRQMETC